MRNAVTDLLGIDVPILAFSHCRDVVAEVSRAGGLGVLGAVAHTPEALEIDLDWIEEQVGDRPYGVDLIIPARYAGDDQGGFTLDDIVSLIPAEHAAFVEDILARYEVPPLPADDEGPGRAGWQTNDAAAPFSANRAGPQLEIALAHRTALVANALGPPPPEMIEQVKGAGRVVAALAGRAVHAERHVAAGVDVIVAALPDEVGLGAAIADRLRRAAGPRDPGTS
ncbi:MAG: nitronate monooxygenase [Myxococcales bacterium]|nr:nitronate monooxygenase [Myxococcales bacterium]